MTDALSWKLPETDASSPLSGPSREEFKEDCIDPIEVLVHKEQIKEVQVS